MSKSSIFLAKCFEKLKDSDFNSDTTLKGFIKSYNGYIESTIKDRKEIIQKQPERRDELMNSSFTTLFDFFFEYLLRNSSSTPEQRNKDILDIQNGIIIAIFNPKKIIVEDQIRERKVDNTPVQKTEQKSLNASTEQINKIENNLCENNLSNPTDVRNDQSDEVAKLLQGGKFKFDKKHLLDVLSECINNSMVSVEVEEGDSNIDEEAMRRLEVDVMTKQLIEEGIKLPTPKRDEGFNRKNKLIEIWHECLNRLMELKKSSHYNVLLKMHYIDTDQLRIGDSYEITTAPLDHIPVEKLVARPITPAQCKPLLMKGNSLTECIRLIREGKQTLYVASEMQFNMGGNSDQGFETPILPFYFATTVSLPLQKYVDAYPLDDNRLFYAPFLIYLRDHNNNYEALPDKLNVPMRAIIAAPRYRPRINIKDIDYSTYDMRLQSPNTEYLNSEKIFKQISGIFNTALFFNQKRIILDDFGAVVNYAPVHNLAKVVGKVLNIYQNHFEDIRIVISDANIYDIFKKYI